MTIQPIPLEYRGVLFRSTLEADWAATLDHMGITWCYEPIAVDLGQSVRYLCDFYLPAQRTWLEVKGPHDQRLHKPRVLHQALNVDEWDWRSSLVIIGRPAEADRAIWQGVSPAQRIVLRHCGRCGHYSFMDYNGTWQCQVCGHHERHCGRFYNSGSYPFTRAPRQERVRRNRKEQMGAVHLPRPGSDRARVEQAREAAEVSPLESAAQVAARLGYPRSASSEGSAAFVAEAAAEAAEWLQDYLTQMDGAAAYSKIKEAGKAAGHANASLKLARVRLGIVAEASGFPRQTYWRLS
jgi:uncharacterized Zn finger protein (UPF0148 family)